MFWLILWLVVSVPFALLLGAFISAGSSSWSPPRETGELGSELHDQTIIG